MKEDEKRFPIFHVPHDGEQFPEELMDSVCISQSRFFRYHEEMRDIMVRQMIPENYRNAEQAVIFPISRLLCDVERFIGPEEVMEHYGMGFCYEKAYDGTVIKKLSEDIREKTLVYYHKHHDRIDRICAQHRRILLVDLHSYSDEIVPRDFLQQGIDTPDICIGTDSFFTPDLLTSFTEEKFRSAGYSTNLNYPYSGCFIPDTVLSGESDCDLVSVMIEVNKRVYLDKVNNPDCVQVLEISNLIRNIADYWMTTERLSSGI